MSFIFSCPVETDNDEIYPDRTKKYSSDELSELIKRYRHCQDIVEREILIEYVDIALDMLERNGSNHESLKLLNEVADLGQWDVIRVPEWTIAKLNQQN